MKPRIGIQAQIGSEGEPIIGEGYMDFIRQAGGEPELFYPVADAQGAEAMIAKYDGILIPGGDDIDARLYGEEPIEGSDAPVGVRDVSEPLLLSAILKTGEPFLGICRGCQICQVAAGGKLYQSISAEVPKASNHWQEPPYDRTSHYVVLVTDAPIGAAALEANIWGPVGVNSLHRQAIRRPLAGDLEVAALSSDSIIEAVYIHDHPYFVGVQWHPELMLENRLSRIIAKTFVDAAAKVADARAKAAEEAEAETKADASPIETQGA